MPADGPNRLVNVIDDIVVINHRYQCARLLWARHRHGPALSTSEFYIEIRNDIMLTMADIDALIRRLVSE